MKKITRILVLTAVVAFITATKGKAQISVNLQLSRPPQYEQNERVHPNRPSPNHVWVAEEWVPNGNGGYNYKPGYWQLPPQLVWVPGYWRQLPQGGYAWDPGHWDAIINGVYHAVKF